ncbi:MAG: hypothetical protein IKX25_07755 [Bacteroidales bacterium]|nr:hypothetical protein [Bacteroidales bacterium]
MKAKSILILCLLCILLSSCFDVKDGGKRPSTPWVPLSQDAEESIVDDYAAALDEFASIMPIFGQDTEALWVADTVHAMAKTVKMSHSLFTKKYATISQMQNYLGYGMAYRTAITAKAKDAELSDYALRIIPHCDSIYTRLRETKFQNVTLLSLFNILSIQNMQLFTTLTRINNNLEMDKEINYTMYALSVVDSLSRIEDYSDKDIYKISAIMESTSYFQMICPLLKLFAGSKEKYNSNMVLVDNAALHFDFRSKPMIEDLGSGKKVYVMEDAKFEEWMLDATAHKVKLLKLLTQYVREYNPKGE